MPVLFHSVMLAHQKSRPTSKDAAVLPRVTVLAAAHDAFRVTDGLRAAGLAVEYWALPSECSGSEAAALSELASADEDWAARLSSTQVLLTAFQTPEILPAAVVPRVLPYLEQGTLWVQMGAVNSDTDREVQAAAERHGLRLLNLPLTWSEGGTSIRCGGSAGAGENSLAREADASLLYGLVLAALTPPGLGLGPAQSMSPTTAETLAEIEREMAAQQRLLTHQPDPWIPGFEPLSESTIWDLEFKQLIDRADPSRTRRGGEPA
ncbi:NAD(P)-binding domain-containing protein [Streptomyces xanthochromogenes]|uniref:NAD(P)-binding domain-containing protein n=1 Tax=Streptomyces xanthochromogenes TaxID=67384 RepID=UPI0038197B13